MHVHRGAIVNSFCQSVKQNTVQCTEQKLCARALTTEEVSYCCRSMPCQSSPTLQHVHWTQQRSSQGVHGTGAVHNGSPNQSSSYIRKFRTDSGFTQHLTRLDRYRQKSTIPGRRHHFHIHAYQNKHSRTVSQGCIFILPQEFRRRQISRGTVLYMYTACRIQSSTSTVKTNFSLDKAENTSLRNSV